MEGNAATTRKKVTADLDQKRKENTGQSSRGSGDQKRQAGSGDQKRQADEWKQRVPLLAYRVRLAIGLHCRSWAELLLALFAAARAGEHRAARDMLDAR
jgi:hypothetical protein